MNMTYGFTLAALLAFAANSVLCRLALLATPNEDAAIDAMGFTLLRLVSGAVTLVLILGWRQRGAVSSFSSVAFVRSLNPFSRLHSRGHWLSGASLFVYAVCFSFAYVQLDTGVGALILFGTVQVCLVLLALLNGHGLRKTEGVGLLLAFVGLLVLVWPSLNASALENSNLDLTGMLLMACAGAGWALYSWQGKGASDALRETTYSFVLSLLPLGLCALLYLAVYASFHVTREGIGLALASGVLASGVGYAIWYQALRQLSAIQSATAMLLVPVLAALAGVVFLNEHLSGYFYVSCVLILCGVLLVTLAKQPRRD